MTLNDTHQSCADLVLDSNSLHAVEPREVDGNNLLAPGFETRGKQDEHEYDPDCASEESVHRHFTSLLHVRDKVHQVESKVPFLDVDNEVRRNHGRRLCATSLFPA